MELAIYLRVQRENTQNSYGKAHFVGKTWKRGQSGEILASVIDILLHRHVPLSKLQVHARVSLKCQTFSLPRAAFPIREIFAGEKSLNEN